MKTPNIKPDLREKLENLRFETVWERMPDKKNVVVGLAKKDINKILHTVISYLEGEVPKLEKLDKSDPHLSSKMGFNQAVKEFESLLKRVKEQ